jgi:hypothetical protein
LSHVSYKFVIWQKKPRKACGAEEFWQDFLTLPHASDNVYESVNPVKKSQKSKATTTTKPAHSPDSAKDLEARRLAEDLAANTGPRPEISFTIIANTAKDGLAAKDISLAEDGKSLKKRAACQIYEGTFGTYCAENMQEIADIRAGLAPNEALVYGVPVIREGRLVTQKALRTNPAPDTIARDREHFGFPEGEVCILMLDYDLTSPRGWQDLDAELCEVCPPIRDVERMWEPSSSAYIRRKDTGEEITGARGWRCCLAVDNAAAIPAIGAAIYQSYWNAGDGWIFITQSGVMLDRAPVDASVWQPERIDFAAPPVVRPPLERNAPEAVIVPGLPYLRSSRVTAEMTLQEFRQSSPRIKTEKAKNAAQALEIRRKWIAARIEKLRAEGCDLPNKQLRKLLNDAAENFVLGPDFVLYPAEGGSVTVEQVLADREKYHGARFRDPLEPFGYDDERIAWASLLNGKPAIHTWGHGRLVFELVRTTASVTVAGGTRSQQVDTCIEVLQARGDLFERAGEIVRVNGDGLKPLDDPSMADYLDRAIEFERYVQTKEGGYMKRIDAPRDVVSIILAKTGQRGLRDLRAVITAPTLRPDGSLLISPGYDHATGLLLKPGEFGRIVEAPSKKELQAAFATFWKPFALFPFAGPEHRAVHLAAALTALVRRSLPTAPGFSIDAPLAGTGKTLLGLCTASLTGATGCLVPEVKEEDELRKRLLAQLRRGGAAILLDNIRDVFGSSALEAFLTSEFYSDRVLGVSEISSFPTDILVLISGNNFTPKGDLWRRLLTCRLDAKNDAPERRTFPFEPLDYCRRHRQELVAAGLTLLRGFVAAGKPAATQDRLASFEAWDKLIRQAVIWLGERKIASVGLADPAVVMAKAKERNPERQHLASILECSHAIFGDGRFGVADIVDGTGGEFTDLTQSDRVKVYTRDGLSRDEATALAAKEVEIEQEARRRLAETVHEIAGDRGGRGVNNRVLGRWLERHADAPVAGKRLVRVEQSEKHRGSAQWRIAL